MPVGKDSIMRATKSVGAVEKVIKNENPSEEMSIAWLSIEQIQQIPYGWRLNNIDNCDLTEIQASIKKHGILEPLIVGKTDTEFQLLSGQRRLEAAKRENIRIVPVIIKEIKNAKVAKEIYMELHKYNMVYNEEANISMGTMEADGLASIHEEKFKVMHFLGSDLPTYLL